MPLVRMNFGLGILAEKRKADLSRKVIDLIAKETGKSNTTVIIREIPQDNWIIERMPLWEFRGRLMHKFDLDPGKPKTD